MSKADYDRKDLVPKIGFEKSIEDSSFSFREFRKNSIYYSELINLMSQLVK